MKFIIIFVLTLLLSKTAFTETALVCSLSKQCLGQLDCTEFEEDTKKSLILINSDKSKLTISKDLVFSGDYFIMNESETEYKGIKYSDLANEDLNRFQEIIKRWKEKSISKDEYKNTFYNIIFKGLTFEFVLNRFLSDLETRMIYHSPSFSSSDTEILRKYKCQLTEKKL